MPKPTFHQPPPRSASFSKHALSVLLALLAAVMALQPMVLLHWFRVGFWMVMRLIWWDDAELLADVRESNKRFKVDVELFDADITDASPAQYTTLAALGGWSVLLSVLLGAAMWFVSALPPRVCVC